MQAKYRDRGLSGNDACPHRYMVVILIESHPVRWKCGLFRQPPVCIRNEFSVKSMLLVFYPSDTGQHPLFEIPVVSLIFLVSGREHAALYRDLYLLTSIGIEEGVADASHDRPLSRGSHASYISSKFL